LLLAIQCWTSNFFAATKSRCWCWFKLSYFHNFFFPQVNFQWNVTNNFHLILSGKEIFSDHLKIVFVASKNLDVILHKQQLINWRVIAILKRPWRDHIFLLSFFTISKHKRIIKKPFQQVSGQLAELIKVEWDLVRAKINF
jgi:hypothetical protein